MVLTGLVELEVLHVDDHERQDLGDGVVQFPGKLALDSALGTPCERVCGRARLPACRNLPAVEPALLRPGSQVVGNPPPCRALWALRHPLLLMIPKPDRAWTRTCPAVDPRRNGQHELKRFQNPYVNG